MNTQPSLQMNTSQMNTSNVEEHQVVKHGLQLDRIEFRHEAIAGTDKFGAPISVGLVLLEMQKLESTIAALEAQLNHELSLRTVSNNGNVVAMIEALSLYANIKNWANPRDQYGELNKEQTNTWFKNFNGYEPALHALQSLGTDELHSLTLHRVA